MKKIEKNGWEPLLYTMWPLLFSVHACVEISKMNNYFITSFVVA